MNEQTVAILGILVTALIPFFGYIYKNRKELKSSYSIIWKASGAMKPKDVLGERPYRDYYYARKEDEQISECLRARKNILLIGPPLSGKSRAVFQALKNFPKRLDVLVPRCVHMQSFQFPFDFKFWKKKIIFIDDLQYYVEKQDYYHMLFNTAKDKNMMLIATCHSGLEFKKVKNKILEHQMDTDIIFGGNIIELGTVSAQVGKQIAEQSGTAWDNVRFNGTIGSIFMRLTEMEKRYDECDNIEKTILRSIKDLYNCGVYEENDVFLLDWIKLVAKYYELEGKDFEWTGWLKALEGKEFIRIVRRNKIWAEDAYLEYIVKSEVEISKIDLFGEMLRIFENQPDALLMLAERAYDIGSIDIDISDYMKITIQAYRRVLDSISDKKSYMYFETMNKLSVAYRTLAEVEDRIENCSAAVELLTKAMDIKSIENSDSLYSSVQNNLGVVYLRLAEVSDRIENCLLAANAFNEALKFRTLVHSPREYAATKCNLGVAYKILSEAEDKIQNASKSVDAYLEGLKVYNPEEDFVYYAAAQNNLGTAYLILGEEENRAENCCKAIEAFNEALKIRTYSRYPLDYAMTQNNLGSAYLAFAEVENTIINCGNAIKAFEEALKVRTIGRFPFQYAVTQYNLGSAYMLLAEVKDKAENCECASDAFKEALKVRTLNKFPFDYALIRYNLGCIYTVLAEQENKSENYRKAIESFDESLKVYDESSYPRQYGLVQKGITRAKKIFF